MDNSGRKWHDFILMLDYGIEELILLIIILLNIFDFFKVLPDEIDYIKKIISWTVLGYLIYQMKPSEILFGKDTKWMDFALIVSYFMLILNKFIIYSQTVYHESLNLTQHELMQRSLSFLPFHHFIVQNSTAIEQVGFSFAMFLMLVMSVFLSREQKFNGPSVAEIFGNIKNPIGRFVVIFGIMISFFIVFINLFLEWLAIAIDAPLMVIGLLFYIFYSRKFPIESYIYKVGDFGESFSKNFINLFHSKQTILLGLSGMLVLHTLTDIGIFMIPYTTGIYDELYLGHLGANHEPLFKLFFLESPMAFSMGFQVVLTYILNSISLILLLVSPAIIWYCFYRKQRLKLARPLLALFFSSLFVFLCLPVYEIVSLREKHSIIGADIITKTVTSNGLSSYITMILAISILIFVGVYLISKIPQALLYIEYLWFICTAGFFGYYVYNFSSSVILYYVTVIITSISSLTTIFTGIIFSLFLIISALFYVVGFFYFVYHSMTM